MNQVRNLLDYTIEKKMNSIEFIWQEEKLVMSLNILIR